jgi:hypothetical protein
MDWDVFLIPDPEVDIRNNDQDVYDEMIENRKKE